MKEPVDAYSTLLGQLAEVLHERTEAAARDRIVLRDAVCAFVAAEQARGTPLSGVILTVKRILREAEDQSTPAVATDALAAQLIAWCREFHQAAVPLIS